MSTRFSRPRRTKVYDCNYTIGENYYRPVVDELDRKYSGRSNIATAANAAESSLSSLRATLAESDSRSARRSAQREIDDSYLDEPRRSRPASSIMEDYDSIFDSHSKSVGSSTKSRALAVIDDDGEEFGTSTNLKRIRAARAARAQALEDEMCSTTTSRSGRSGMDYAEKVLDSVGLRNSDIGKARLALADDALFSKRSIKIVSSSSEVDGGDNSGVTKWSKLGADSDGVDETLAAAARARKSRARIADLEAEMGELADRTAAREKRNIGLRALVAENEANSNSSSKVSSSSSVRKVSSSVTSEKKTVTF